jgi:MoaA/NifB/PqqE/SkfB family radical SAM enzyme
MSTATAPVSKIPRVSLTALDDLWFQVAGTLCNLRCSHCFISCSPTNRTFELIGLEQALETLEESKKLGVKEYYFTGGEPFIHPRIVEILEATLAIGPATVLTNAILLKPKHVKPLAAAVERSLYSLEFRVSIDGYAPEMNDAIRGKGTFVKAMNGVQLLLEHGFLPIITVAQTWEDGRNDEVFARFVEVLEAEGYSRLRIKIIPTLRMGAEEKRTRGYDEEERVTEQMMGDFDTSQLVCSHSRMVTNKGIYVCPILIESPEARLGSTLEESLDPFPLRHGACYTCYIGGALCSNSSSGGADVS